MALKISDAKLVDSFDFDRLVEETYGRHYVFQQQNGCKSRGTHHFTVPSSHTDDESMHDKIQETVNGSEMGVKFAVWLERDPEKLLPPPNQESYCNALFWERNFYPDFETLINDMHEKGVLEAGKYCMEIDW